MLFSELASYFDRLEATASRLTMTELLSDLFRNVREEDVGYICYLLQGRVAPLYEPLEFGVADKFMIRAIAKAVGEEVDVIVKAFRNHGDMGSAAQEVRSKELGKRSQKKRMHVKEVYDVLFEVAKTGGEGSQEKKISLLAELLRACDPLSAKYIVRITLGKLRLGFSDMTILDALSWMETGDKSLREPLERAYNLRPDIGFIARKVKEKGVKGLHTVKAVVGAPILSSLCQRLPTADEMIEKMGKVFVEGKYDGVRVQIHFEKAKGKGQTAKVKTFSRNLENTTEMFPELEDIRNQIDGSDVILDSEAVGVDPKTGKIMAFQETTTRKRKHNIQLALASVPLRFYVFDILVKDGKDLLSKPLYQRRELLESTVRKGGILSISPAIVTNEAVKVREYHEEQRKRGLEGVVVKKWDGAYEPGRRGFSWVKFKEEEGHTGKLTDTIDAVVMGYYLGEGKRNAFGIGAFLVGVRSGESFVTVTKIGTGVSDELWKELLTKLRALKTKEKPKEYGEVHKILIPDQWVVPKMVVELAGDDLTKSPTHGAGFAVRFPRLVRIRTDKSPRQVTTVKEVKELYKTQ